MILTQTCETKLRYGLYKAPMPLPVIATGNASVIILTEGEARTRFHLDICLPCRQPNSAV